MTDTNCSCSNSKAFFTKYLPSHLLTVKPPPPPPAATMPLNRNAHMLYSPATMHLDARELFLDKYGGVYVKLRNISLCMLHSKGVLPLSRPPKETKVCPIF